MEKLCVVKRPDSQSKKITGILLVILGVVILVLSFLFWKLVLILPAIACFVVYVLNYVHAEISFDYTFFGSEVKIARIKGDNRRKLLHMINMDDVRMITKADDPILYNVEKEPGAIKKDYTSQTGEGTVYKLVYKEKDKTVILDIEPSEEFLDALCEKYSKVITR